MKRANPSWGRNQFTRRDFIAATSGLCGMATVTTIGNAAPINAKAPSTTPTEISGVRVLTFDVFGTVVDWRGSIIREGEEWGKAKRLHVNWGKFADRWHAGNPTLEDEIRKGTVPWMTADAEHRLVLDEVLKEFGITGLTEEEKDHWNRVYHRLTPWPDAVTALTRLRKKYIVAPLSNGNVSCLVDMAKSDGLPWDMILSAELFHRNKPDREVYLGAADLLGCKPSEVMHVAAHVADLKAARTCGLRTAFVSRPLENGPGGKADSPAGESFDVVARDFPDLAVKVA
jgi:2-haloacid dehalogenase